MPKKLKIIEANTIILKDKKGRTRIYMDAADMADFPQICLFGNNGSSLALAATDDACSLTIHLPGGKVGASFGVKWGEGSGVHLYDLAGNPSIFLQSSTAESPEQIRFYPKKRKLRRNKLPTKTH